jgi:hypothetical protein
MKKFFTPKAVIFCAASLFLLLNVLATSAQTPQVKKTTISLLSDDGTNSSIAFHPAPMLQRTVTTANGQSVVISTNKGTPILKKGFPDLPKLTTSLIIPGDKDMQVTVTGSEFTDYQNVNVAPSKGTMVRTIDPSSVPYTYADVYLEDAFWPSNLAELRDPYILRDFRGQTVIVYPYQYNPVSKTLRVYSEITVSVSPKASGTGINPLIVSNTSGKVSSEFNHVYSNHFLNYTGTTRYTPIEEEGNMLIISYGPFMEAMQPFVDWKIQKGMRTEMVDVATIGNTAAAIKDYVTNYYNTNGLTFLLLVGDDAQLKASSTGAGDSDNDYGYLEGNDHYQELFVGRFSAETADEVTTQVNRTLSYEKTPIIDSYYAQGVGIASEFGPGDDNEWDWEHEENLRTELVNYNYDEIHELFNGTWSGATNDASGNPSATDLSNWVNTGIGIINYTGHGSTTSIATTNFTNTSVNTLLSNTQKWPFLWIVGCEVGNFAGSTCFGEAWARLTHEGEPAGALASMMSTINQYWDEPMEGQDEMNAILTESYSNNIKRTFGGISINGCFSMNDAYGNSGFNMTDTWDCFGDPSVYVRTTIPQDMTVSHDPTLLLGMTEMNVNCNAENAVAALTANGEILGTATVSGGIAHLTFTALTAVETLTLTITGYNQVPNIAEIPTVAPAGPFVITDAFVVNDFAANNNGLAEYAENVSLDIQLKNVGITMASSVTATLASTDPFVNITDATESFGNIMDNAISTKSSAFSFTVADNVPDEHTALFVCTMTDNAANTWTSNFSIVLNAPVIGAQSYEVNDAGGNGDGYLDPGETATITVFNMNTGHSNITGAVGTLFTSSPYVVISNPSFNVGDIAIGDQPQATYDVSVAFDAPFGVDVPFDYSVASGAYNGDYNFVAILAPAIEDFETNDFLQFAWQLSGTTNWFTTDQDPFEGLYCAQSGDIGSNQSTTLQIDLDVQFDDDISFAKRVSSEAGYDMLSFYIDGQLQDEWSGEEDWTTVTYPVVAGTHSFKWTYKKDSNQSDGGDCGWLDNILLPAFEVNTATAAVEAGVAVNEVNVYPNPFSGFTSISYQLGQASQVTIKIFDVSGKEIRTLAENENQSSGSYQVALDARALTAGVYFCKVTVDGKIYEQKLVLSK